jgi:hypothetical protein
MKGRAPQSICAGTRKRRVEMRASSEGTEKFLREVGGEIKRRALAVKEELKAQGGTAEEPFLEGMLIAYRRTIGLMQEKAAECDMDLGSIALDDIDPKRDLRSMKVM